MSRGFKSISEILGETLGELEKMRERRGASLTWDKDDGLYGRPTEPIVRKMI